VLEFVSEIQTLNIKYAFLCILTHLVSSKSLWHASNPMPLLHPVGTMVLRPDRTLNLLKCLRVRIHFLSYNKGCQTLPNAGSFFSYFLQTSGLANQITTTLTTPKCLESQKEQAWANLTIRLHRMVHLTLFKIGHATEDTNMRLTHNVASSTDHNWSNHDHTTRTPSRCMEDWF